MQRLDNLPAPAKLNLFLHVVGKLANGYHLLQSVFVLLDWHDTLHFERRSGGGLSREDLSAPLPADDLCLRAARALQSASGTPLGAHIRIDKQLPSGAGLGGGSSDAATTLLALNRLWGLNWPRSALQPLALKLGADVPFFVGGRPAWVEGIGEQLHPLSMPPQTFVVIKPPASAPTQTIFSSPLLAIRSQNDTVWRFARQQIDSDSFEFDGAQGLSALQQGWGQNDLQAAAQAECPEITVALQMLSARFGNSRMTGSGSAVFARLNQNQNQNSEKDKHCDLAAVSSWLDSLPTGWSGRWCVSLNAHPLWSWAAD